MNAKGIQEERDLNTLLMDEGAQSVLGEAIVWEMRSLLIERTGPNLRSSDWGRIPPVMTSTSSTSVQDTSPSSPSFRPCSRPGT